MRTIVFAGPSISHDELRRITDARIERPIRRGDLELFAEHDAFVIVDGEFGQNLSVSPKEILAQLDIGKLVIGAASMGALRASELDSCGMIGVGWVYERFANSLVRRDDDVALLYSPIDFAALTIPMVNVIYWTEMLEQSETLSKMEIATIIRASRRVFFGDRTEKRLRATIAGLIGTEKLQQCLSCTAGVIPDIKRIDAECAVRLLQMKSLTTV